MKLIAIFILSLFLLGQGCNQKPEHIKKQVPDAKIVEKSKPEDKIKALEKFEGDLTIVKILEHDPNAFTQGLLFHDGYLYESTGLRGQSSLRKIDPETGKMIKKQNVSSHYFGEGITLYNNKIYMLTYTSRVCLVFDINTFLLESTFDYFGEGWGLTFYDRYMYMSDGSSFIRILNPDNFNILSNLQVFEYGLPVKNINELEWVHGYLFANVWMREYLIIIDPQTGEVVRRINCDTLRGLQSGPDAEALNGIAFDPETEYFYLTGKNWDKMFVVKFEN